MKRRRFLTLSACFAGFPVSGHAATWRGHALGSDVAVTLTGPRQETSAMLAKIPDWLEAIEAEFSLYRPSTLTRLNAKGTWHTGGMFNKLLHHCHNAWTLTNGLFDPTVQPLWQAFAQGKDPTPAWDLVGWDRLSFGFAEPVHLQPGQQLTFNGIAQGYATDIISEMLSAHGFTDALIDIGEQRALGGPFHLSLADPEHGRLGQRSLSNRAIATSSPDALILGAATHIIAPDRRVPLWSTVSIEAETATMADALSTAAVFMTMAELEHLKANANLHRITIVDRAGSMRSL